MLAHPHRICLQDLEFGQLNVPMRTDFGVGYTRIERFGVPKIPSSVLNAVFYLYKTEADAEAGHDPGGTGFIIGWNKGPYVGGPGHYYAVTNWHVAVQKGRNHPPYPVIRINTRANKTKVLPLRPHDWYFLPDGPDIAVAPIDIDSHLLKWSYIPTDSFAVGDDIWNGRVALGDDVFMIGMFVDHD